MLVLSSSQLNRCCAWKAHEVAKTAVGDADLAEAEARPMALKRGRDGPEQPEQLYPP
jgi:hypothetical protein